MAGLPPQAERRPGPARRGCDRRRRVKRRPELGLVVNPLAGLGGPLALKGSDGPRLPLPLAPGTLSHAERRARVALRELSLGCPEVEVVTYPGPMGELATDAAGLSARIVGRLPSGGTSGRDTRWAIRELIGVGVDLILFAGGDGTAVDVLQAASDSLVALGVPAGVKMHSGVFGITPSHAGAAGAAFLNSDRRRTSDAEIVDLDEEAARAGVVLPRLRGVLRTPADRARIQATKTRSSIADVDALDAAAHMIATRMAPGRMYILGPGTSTRAVSQALGLAHTLLGVDVVRDRRLVALDVDAVQLDKLLEQHVATLVLSPSGRSGISHRTGKSADQHELPQTRRPGRHPRDRDRGQARRSRRTTAAGRFGRRGAGRVVTRIRARGHGREQLRGLPRRWTDQPLGRSVTAAMPAPAHRTRPRCRDQRAPRTG